MLSYQKIKPKKQFSSYRFFIPWNLEFYRLFSFIHFVNKTNPRGKPNKSKIKEMLIKNET